MDFLIRKAGWDDVPGIMRVMETARDTVPRREWFVADEEPFVREHIEENGFVLAAQAENGEIAGFFLIHIPGLTEKNLGRSLGLPAEELPAVAHMDSAAVLPAYRGNGLQARLLREAERRLAGGPYSIWMSTVHPDNCYSLANMLAQGYRVAATMKKYGGLDRHILIKRYR